MAEIAIRVTDVHKSFKIYYDKGQSFKEKILFQNRNRHETRIVLNGVSFAVQKGEAIGLIGQNGCGKSTMLKLLTKIMYPDSGSIEMTGRVSSLIELGAGFHQDMTGKENIYTNASIFGLTRKEIDARIMQIIEFSELGEFIDNPVRTYSSGMYMRLAFAVAINVDADILLIDEILAVGDASFQSKCFNKLREIKAQGTTIVIVSHSLGQIEQICERSIWIDQGIISAEGAPRDIHPNYMNYMSQKNFVSVTNHANTAPLAQPEINQPVESQSHDSVATEPQVTASEQLNTRWGNGKVRIISVESFDIEGRATNSFGTGDFVHLVVKYQVKLPISDAIIGIAFYRNDGVHCYGTNTMIDGLPNCCMDKDGKVEILLSKLLLLPGQYDIDFAIESFPSDAVDYYKKAYKLEVYSAISDVGLTRIDHRWVL